MDGSSDFGTFGRFTERPLSEMPADQQAAYALDVKLRGQAPGPQKIWISNPKLNEVLAPLGAYFDQGSTLTGAEVEIATNLTVAHWLSAYASYVHEKAAEKKVQLLPDKVEALITGLPTSFDDPRQQVVYEVASALIALRIIPMGLYRRAVDLLGDAGLVDITVLIGYFTGISLTLRAYDVPANATGLKR